MTSKQRAGLRSLANGLEPVFQIGKGGINENLVVQVDECLEKRELIKITLLQSCEMEAREACRLIAQAVEAEPVQCIGRRFVLYRASRENPRIDLRAFA
jgi:RNA-binding protein